MSKGFFKGVIIGGIVGSVAALLYAPKKGEEMRADIKNKLDTANTELSHKLQEAKKSAGPEAKELITKGEQLQRDISSRSAELAKSGSKISSVAIVEAKNLAAKAKELANDLSKSTNKVVTQSQKEVARMQQKAASARAKKTYVDNSKTSASKTKKK